MYLSELKLWNFRKYGSSHDAEGRELPGLHIKFNKDFNLLVGENDSGKTAIIDAIKHVLLTQSGEYQRFDIDDFHLPKNAASEAQRAKELMIECVFRGFEEKEAKNFLEWLNSEDDENSQKQFYLRLFLKAERGENRIFCDGAKAGADDEGKYFEARARDFLRITYLKPLRDAEQEMDSRKNSRLSQVLYSHKAFEEKDGEEDHKILEIIQNANNEIKKYFDGKDEDGNHLPDQEGKNLLEQINTYLEEFAHKNTSLQAGINIANVKLKTILEKLSLDLSESKVGLGSQNLLFIAVEFLLLQREEYTGYKGALIEEIESHLHVQAQLRLIDYLQTESEDRGIQLFLTSHSATLASKVKLEKLIIFKEDKVFPMGDSYTNLEKGDYLFLERFLDATKANLFFAQGVILVEGDAENLLIPIIAEIIDFPLSKYGVSIVNVGGTAFLRYSRIFQRRIEEKSEKDEEESRNIEEENMSIPVACITDCDVKPDIYKQDVSGAKTEEDYEEGISGKIDRIKQLYDGQTVETFVSSVWTLEFAIACSSLKEDFYKAVLFAEKIANSNTYTLTPEKITEVETKVRNDFEQWNKDKWRDEKIAYEIYKKTLLDKHISKAIVAQCFGKALLENNNRPELKATIVGDAKLKYMVDAIKYATGNNLQNESNN